MSKDHSEKHFQSRFLPVAFFMMLAMLVWYFFISGTPEQAPVSGYPATLSPAMVSQTEPENDAALVANGMTTPGETVPSNMVQVDADLPLQEARTVDLLGIKIRLRELRTDGARGAEGELRNLEFFIREGIRPRQLFEDSRQVITGYWPLYHNNVGYGAVTQRLLYQFVEQDTNGDGQLSSADAATIATSLPDGSEYRVLGQTDGAIVDVTYLSDRGTLSIDVVNGEQIEQRQYSLEREETLTLNTQ